MLTELAENMSGRDTQDFFTGRDSIQDVTGIDITTCNGDYSGVEAGLSNNLTLGEAGGLLATGALIGFGTWAGIRLAQKLFDGDEEKETSSSEPKVRLNSDAYVRNKYATEEGRREIIRDLDRQYRGRG